MRRDHTDITVVMDRSGSMASTREDAEGGVNAFVEEQRKAPGFARLTLVQFDTEYEFVHRAVPIKDVPRIRLAPRGCTALCDAVGRAIVDTGARLAGMPEKKRPGLVVFVVVTDGGENASREYTRAKIKEMIEHQQAKYSWKFIFVGANQDAFAEARTYGIDLAGTANYVPHTTHVMYAATAANVTRMRSASLAGVVAGSILPTYTAQEQAAMSGVDPQAEADLLADKKDEKKPATAAS